VQLLSGCLKHPTLKESSIVALFSCSTALLRRQHAVPTILRHEGYRFFFFSNESQEPPQVHIEKESAYAKIWLNPLELAASSGFKRSEMRRMREITTEHQDDFLEAWHAHFDR
jgi:hypothetical protein